MEKIFTNKKIWKKIVVAILVIMAFQFLMSTPIVRATESTDEAPKEGDNLVYAGILMRPILSLFVTIGDGVINLLHSTIMGQQQTLIPVAKDSDFFAVLGGILAGVLAFAVVIVAAVLTLGAVAAVVAAVGSAVTVGGIGMGTVVVAVAGGAIAGTAMYERFMPETLQLPLYSYSAEEIFENNILLFNVDFFNPSSNSELYVCYREKGSVSQNDGYNGGSGTYVPGDIAKDTVSNQKERIEKKEIEVQYYFYYKNGEEIKTSPHDSARELRQVISRWYVGIRNICIVIMLSVLIYIGIRMMLTTVANDKAKYKEMFKDWVIGLCLLFLMHYIMAFSVAIVEKLNDVVKTGVNNNQTMMILPDKYDGELVKTANELGFTEADGFITNDKDKDGNDIKTVAYPTNLMGKIRLKMQERDDMQQGEYIGLVICFLVLVIFTVVFTITYLKRLLHMVFLTIIAPLVATTYCIDKVNDGNAQGFNIWLKEYIFNLLIQPVHLLLYYLLVSSAFELSSKNVIYSLVAIGFLLPAEKLLRSMFGFEKAKTPPLLGGPVGTSLMMQGINRMTNLARGGRNGQSSAGDNRKGLNTNEDNKFIGDKINMGEALSGDGSGNPHEEGAQHTSSGEREHEGIREGAGGRTRGNEGEDDGQSNEWATPEIAQGMQDLDAEQENLDTMFGEDDLDGLSDDDITARDQLQGELDGRRQRLMEENERLRMANIPEEFEENPEDNEAEQNDEQGANGETTSENQQENEKNGTFRQAYGAYTKTQLRSMLAIGSTPKQTLKNNAKRLGAVAYKGAAGVAKRVPGVAVGLAAGGAAAVLGGAAAIASGDEKSIMTAAGAAAGAGYAVGSRIAGTMTTTNLDEGTKQALEAVNTVYDTDERKKKQQERQFEETRTNGANIIKAERTLGKEKAKEFMGKDGNMSVMLESGVTNFDHMLAIEQGINAGDFRDVNEGLGTYAMLERFGGKGPEQMDAKGKENLDKTIMNVVSPRLGRDSRQAVARRDRIKNNMDNLYQRINK